MANKTFTEWLIIKTIKTQYGEIKKLSFKVEEFKDFMDKYDNNWWINIDLLQNKEWKEYSVLNEYKQKEESKDIEEDFIPF